MPETDDATGGPGTTEGRDSDFLTPHGVAGDAILASFSTAESGLTPVSLGSPASVPRRDTLSDDRVRFWIRLANTPERRRMAGLLIERLYARQGYRHDAVIKDAPDSITLISCDREDRVIGTVTIRMDSPGNGLLADETYKTEIDLLRARGKRLCEFNGLAVDSSVRSKLVIARLFHIAMLYPWGLFGCTDCVIEVSPSHASFYCRMLGFEQLGAAHLCPRVNAVGVLLHVDFVVTNERLARVGGLMNNAGGDHSLLPYGFSKTDADGILDRLKRMV